MLSRPPVTTEFYYPVEAPYPAIAKFGFILLGVLELLVVVDGHLSPVAAIIGYRLKLSSPKSLSTDPS